MLFTKLLRLNITYTKRIILLCGSDNYVSVALQFAHRMFMLFWFSQNSDSFPEEKIAVIPVDEMRRGFARWILT